MTMPGRVICLGDVMVDVLARLPGPLAVGSDTPAPVAMLPGGSAANTAAWLAGAGVAATFVGRVGDDLAGAAARDALRAAGVEPHLQVDRQLATGTCIVLVDATGERTMIPDPGANAALASDALAPELFSPGAHLHVSGYAIFGGARDAATHALALARRAGMTISVGAASAQPLRRFGARRFLDAIGDDLLLFANADEAAVLSDCADPRAAAFRLQPATGRVVVTRGSAGALWCGAPDAIVDEPVVAAEVVDSTGAGDAFAAGALAAWLRGDAPRDALRRGHALAASAVATPGARPGRTLTGRA